MWFFEKGSELKIIFSDCVNLQRVVWWLQNQSEALTSRLHDSWSIQDVTKNCFRSSARSM